MDSAVRTLCQGFLDYLLGPFRPHGKRHHLASMFLFQTQPFLQSETIRLIHLEADISFADPRAAFGDVQRRILGGNLLDANGDLHLHSDSWIVMLSCVEFRSLPALE